MKYITALALFLILNGCAIFQGKSSPDQYVTDTSITAKIKSKLIRSDNTSASNIHVETQNGIVQLSGFVGNSSQITEAERLSRTVEGVKGVANNLRVSYAHKLHRAS